MPFLVQGCLDDHTLAVTTATAKEAFAKAVEWHETGRSTYVSISDSTKSSGRKITAVNSVESRKESAPSLSHSTMATPITLTQVTSVDLMQPQSKIFSVTRS